jgi:hypothetical protein
MACRTSRKGEDWLVRVYYNSPGKRRIGQGQQEREMRTNSKVVWLGGLEHTP